MKNIVKLIPQLQIILLIIFIGSGFIFADVTRKRTELSEGTFYIYYDSENKEIAREKYSHNPFDRELISGQVPDGIVIEETKHGDYPVTIEENYKYGKPNGLVKSTMSLQGGTVISELKYSNNGKDMQIKTTTTVGFGSSISTSNIIDGKMNGVSRITMHDKDGDFTTTMEMTYEDNEMVGGVKCFDKNGNYDPKMSKEVSEAMASLASMKMPESGTSKNEEETDPLSGKSILLVIPSGKGSDTEQGIVKKMLELNAGTTTVVELKGAEIKLDAEGFDAVMFLGCMESSKSFWENKTVIDFVKKVNSSNKIIGAIGFAPSALAKAGILKEKDATAGEGEELQKTFKDNGVNYKKKEVVVAGNIVTANGAKAIKKFTKELIKLLQNKK
jgi:putative intracellular protease/amidase